MKIKTFYRLLKKLTRKGWEAKRQPSGEIRMREPGGMRFCFCPITAVCLFKTGDRINMNDYKVAAHKICLHHETAHRIAASADGPSRMLCKYSSSIDDLLEKALLSSAA